MIQADGVGVAGNWAKRSIGSSVSLRDMELGKRALGAEIRAPLASDIGSHFILMLAEPGPSWWDGG